MYIDVQYLLILRHNMKVYVVLYNTTMLIRLLWTMLHSFKLNTQHCFTKGIKNYEMVNDVYIMVHIELW